MYAIYQYQNGKQFTGIIARTEEEAWIYLNKKYGCTINGVHCGCNREAFVVEKVVLV